MPPKTKKQKMIMTDDHKAALAEGRRQGAAVRTYLDALEQHRPKRGRKRTSESIGKRLGAIEIDLKAATSVERLQLIQERMDLKNELAGMDAKVDLSSSRRSSSPRPRHTVSARASAMRPGGARRVGRRAAQGRGLPFRPLIPSISLVPQKLPPHGRGGFFASRRELQSQRPLAKLRTGGVEDRANGMLMPANRGPIAPPRSTMHDTAITGHP